ncbi:MBL fold metallo-hydrolase [Azonexus sp.]|jgi:glyoxylase-like metal-dependent hydrolase (beta-lactamase superfamily II)|uniref:MBL fold metallo-hydrolase n=1 Tax=Azonexus sp. TaxID=1872668 RepID=UPI00282D845E|nr:MBL fold metallo-hydrolase [Azonexus sp.]MDR1995027.1 MBL fold metallo-hydrolase [Azonexus sp.]
MTASLLALPGRPALARLLLAVLFLFVAGFAAAEAPPQKNQVPGYYRLMLGNFEITALYDGAINLDETTLKNISIRDRQRLLARQFLQGPKVQTAVNAYLVNTGSRLILIDAGAAGLFGPSLGRVVDNLRAAGYQPEQVDTVLLTHLHGDHVNGLVSPDGGRVFANAEVWSAQADNDFWLSEAVAAKAPVNFQAFFKMSRDAAAPYLAAGKWKTFSSDRELLPGVASVDTRGHTPGHASYLITSGGERLLVLGDLVHNHAVQFARPEVSFEFDNDPQQAIHARKRIFERAAKEKLMVAGMHLPFPGIGHVRKEKQGYAWVPAEFAPLETR